MTAEIVRITWRDAVSDEGAFDVDDLSMVRLLEMVSVGYLIKEDSEKVVLARDYFAEGNYRALIVIPTRAIISTMGMVEE